MIKFEMHAHVKGGSTCAKSDAEQLVQDYVKSGYGGVVITTHYDNYNYFNSLVGQTHKEKIDNFFSLFDKTKEKAEENGLKLFYGVEVRDSLGTEYMLYGFKRSFLYDNKPLFTFDQKELFKMAEKSNLFMYQTHPFRNGVKCGLPEFMHGAEIFNGHFHHGNNNERAVEFVKKNKLIEMAGTDYHVFGQPLTSSMYIPENINDNESLTEYLMSGKAEWSGNEEYYQQEYKRFLGAKNAN